MREPDQLPKRAKEPRDYKVAGAIGGYEYLEVPDDDIRWQHCISCDHSPCTALPVTFFEVIAKRLSKTDDLDKFLKGLPIPIVIRRFFKGNPEKLKLYINTILEMFPAIIRRAGFLNDEDSLEEGFVTDFEKNDLKKFYSKSIQEAISRDVPVIGAALSKLEGWDAPEKHEVAQVSTVRHILDSVADSQRLGGSPYCPLPEIGEG